MLLGSACRSLVWYGGITGSSKHEQLEVAMSESDRDLWIGTNLIIPMEAMMSVALALTSSITPEFDRHF